MELRQRGEGADALRLRSGEDVRANLYVTKAENAAARAESAAAAARTAQAKPPIPGDNGLWKLWDPEAGVYTDSQKSWRGAPGPVPVVELEPVYNGVRINTINNDGNGNISFDSVMVMHGADGVHYVPRVENGMLSWRVSPIAPEPGAPVRIVGKSAYEQAVEGGYSGTEADFITLLANLPAPNSGVSSNSGGQSGQSSAVAASYDANARKLTLSGSSGESGESSGSGSGSEPVVYDFTAATAAANFADAFGEIFPNRTSLTDKITMYTLASKAKSQYAEKQLVLALAVNASVGSDFVSGLVRYNSGGYNGMKQDSNYACTLAVGDGFIKQAFNDSYFANPVQTGETAFTADTACTLANGAPASLFGASAYQDGGLYLARYVGNISNAPQQQIALCVYSYNANLDVMQCGFLVRRQSNGDYYACALEQSYGAKIAVGDQYAIRKLNL